MSKTSRRSIEECKQVATARGGKCLSPDYKNNKFKLIWECSEGHQWSATFANVAKGSWCPDCSLKEKSDKQRLSMDECQKYADFYGGKCLATEYINTRTPMEWQCSHGHNWFVDFHEVRAGHWCPKCGAKRRGEGRKLPIELCQQHAETMGGKCLTAEYENCKTNMQWQCSLGHTWEANFFTTRQSKWCPICSKRKHPEKVSLEDCKKIAKTREGKCLSTEYKNSTTKMMWECSVGHQWETTLLQVKNKHWCPKCGIKNRICRENEPRQPPSTMGLGHEPGQKPTIGECRALAQSKGGDCLSHEYKNKKQKLLWACAEGHQWETFLPIIKGGCWCPICNNTKKHTIQDCHRTASDRGFLCLSTEYANCDAKLQWECSEKHQWWASFSCIKAGSGCPICKTKSQEKLQHILEELLHEKSEYNFNDFNWLFNEETSGTQQIDIYFPALKLAVEYDGKQHFMPVEFFGGEEQFELIKSLDKRKNKKIAQHPEDVSCFIRFNYAQELTIDFVREVLQQNGVVIPEPTPPTPQNTERIETNGSK